LEKTEVDEEEEVLKKVKLELNPLGFLPIILVFAVGVSLILLSGNYEEELMYRMLFFGYTIIFISVLATFLLAIKFFTHYYSYKLLEKSIKSDEIKKKMEEKELSEEEVLEEVFK